jgi:hypothetical protein
MAEPATGWSELYREALFESDHNRLPARIDEARQAILCRARELFYAGSPETRERRDLNAALHFLGLLRMTTARSESRSSIGSTS